MAENITYLLVFIAMKEKIYVEYNLNKLSFLNE